LSSRPHLSHSGSKRVLLDLRLSLGGNTRGLYIKPIPSPILLLLVLLGERYLQATILLCPLRHKGVTCKLILNLNPVNLRLLRLALELIISAESVQIGGSTICFVGVAELAQS
jgi:hypothetical protein